MHRPPFQPELGQKLLAMRIASGKTLFEAAYESGSTPQAVSMWERGDRMPAFDRIARLVEVYGRSLDELVKEAS